MIDYFFRWTDEAAAKADAVLLANHFSVQISSSVILWARERVLPGIQAWRPSQDSSGVHNYLSGFFAIVAIPQQSSVLLNASALQFALDRDACNAGQPFVVQNNIGTVITDVACQPIFCGSTYPIGGYSS